MHDHLRATHERFVRVLRDRIEPAVHEVVAPVRLASWCVGEDGEPVTAAHALGLGADEGRSEPVWTPFALGEPWGEPWVTRWFRVDGTVPPGVTGDVELLLDLGWFDHSVGGHCEGLLFTPDGVPVKGLHPKQRWVRVRGDGARPGLVDDDGRLLAYVEAAANPLLLGLPPFVVTPHGEKGSDEPFEQYRVRTAELAVFRPEVFAFARDLEVAAELAQELSPDGPRHWRLLRGVEEALDAFDERDPVTTALAGREVLAPLLAQPAEASAHRVTAVGHAHMDSAWLWPLRETVRKLGRTVSNALALLDADPDLVYTMTSSQHLAWVEEHYPDLFERVRAYVAQGRFVPVGGMWVEADGMMPTGESFVRQILHGKRFLAERFDLETHEIWMPDSFGYSGVWPQLARRSGSEVFLTQKISWNDTTTFPHHSFWWEGIDGTRVFTHFPPSDTYAASVTAAELAHSVRNFKDKAVASHSLLAYGYGDGGGGPTREMAARLSRFRDLEGAPRVESRSPAAFFADAAGELEALPPTSAPAPVWSGELYLELHRGSLTSQQAMKRGNRRCEALLRTAEKVSATAAVLAGHPYPHERLDAIWQDVLLHQFHDILPGSSIAWVHREARATYERLERELVALVEEAVAALPADAVTRPEAAAEQVPDAGTDAEDHVLDNGVLRVRFDASGHVTSLVRVADGVETVAHGGRLNRFEVFRDEPVRWDAWDLDRHVLRHPQGLDAAAAVRAVREDGSAGVEVTRRFGRSTVVVTTWLRPGADRVEVSCDVDWREREHLLKVGFPLAVRARHARYETQYGLVERPLHTNTAGDEAVFEGAVHRWLQVGDVDGAAVLNRTVAGADARSLPGGDTLVRLSLLRGARFPDPDADEGRHHFDWAVVPGADVPAAVRGAVDFCRAPEEPRGLVDLVALDLDRGHAVLDWVKLAEDGSGDLVVRVHETQGARAVARLAVAVGTTGVVETDLLERPAPVGGPPLALGEPGAAPIAVDDAVLRLGPFQVATLRLGRARRAAPTDHPPARTTHHPRPPDAAGGRDEREERR